MLPSKYSPQELEKAIKFSSSWRETLIKLGMRSNQKNRVNAKKRATVFGFDFSHFLGRAIWTGKTCNGKDPIYLLTLDGIGTKSHYLKGRLIRYGYKEYRCEKCNNTRWNGELIPIELHHINGNKKDNRLENLQILCPNCHAQTPNYTAKNKKQFASLSQK